MKKTVAELGESLSSRELAEWMAFFQLREEERQRGRLAEDAAAKLNAWPKRR